MFFGISFSRKNIQKKGLYVWIAMASIVANIIVCKNVNILGYTYTLGNILFASNFLATDIMIEKYSVKDSRRAISLGLISVIIFIIITRIAILFAPDETDMAHQAMETLFNFTFRTSLASLFMNFVSNMLDIYIFQKLREKYPKKLWLRNNLSTIISNCSENFIFIFLAFVGIYDVNTMLTIAITTSVAEIIISLCDTPFLYLAKKEIKIKK